MFTLDESRKLLNAAGVFFDRDDEDEITNEVPAQMLNLNDTWGWACADGEVVPDDEMPRLAELFWSYGNCGVLFWASERNNHCRSEFHDINRFIDFVRMEETIREQEPNSSKRAYAKHLYSIGVAPQ